MSRKLGLLADIQAGAVDESVSLENLLNKCMHSAGRPVRSSSATGLVRS